MEEREDELILFYITQMQESILVHAACGLRGRLDLGLLWDTGSTWMPHLIFSSSKSSSEHYMFLSSIPKYNNIIRYHTILIITKGT